jgi:hypothetical protein
LVTTHKPRGRVSDNTRSDTPDHRLHRQDRNLMDDRHHLGSHRIDPGRTRHDGPRRRWAGALLLTLTRCGRARGRGSVDPRGPEPHRGRASRHRPVQRSKPPAWSFHRPHKHGHHAYVVARRAGGEVCCVYSVGSPDRGGGSDTHAGTSPHFAGTASSLNHAATRSSAEDLVLPSTSSRTACSTRVRTRSSATSSEGVRSSAPAIVHPDR